MFDFDRRIRGESEERAVGGVLEGNWQRGNEVEIEIGWGVRENGERGCGGRGVVIMVEM